MTQPKTPAEALQVWRDTAKYLGDDPCLSPEDVCALANQVLELARTEGVELETLVPDENERKSLTADAEEFQEELKQEEDFYASMDD